MTHHLQILSCCTAIVATITATANAQPAEIQITKGAFAGSVVKILSKTTNSTTYVAHRQLMVSQERTNWPICVEVDGVKTNLSATLAAYGFNVSISQGATNRSASFFAMVIESNTKPPLWWFCTRSAGYEMPRDFKVFTTQSGNSYACYVDLGLIFFRVNAMVRVEDAWREHWEQNANTTAIPKLGIGELFERLGRHPWVYFDAQYFTGVVDNIFEVDGELRVELHARTREPKYTFALRSNKWELVSSIGNDPYKGMTLDQILDVRKRAYNEQFLAEVSAKSEGKNPFEGLTPSQERGARDDAISKRIERIEAELSTRAAQTNGNSGLQTNKQVVPH